MFHFSADRLAGLDTMILKITAPPKVPTLIPNHPHDTYGIPARKLRKQKRRCETRTRTPLADKTVLNNLVTRPYLPTSSMLSHPPYAAGEANLLLSEDLSSRVPCSPDLPSFRPLPPLPSASSLQLPSFLKFSTRSFASPADPSPRRSVTPLPASIHFHVSSPPTPPSRHAAGREAKNYRVFEGPQWIPAFHHPNSPYVPWSSPVRRRILPPPSPLSPPPVCPSSPRIRSGAVAPEPWASSTFSHVDGNSRKDRLLSSWKSFKNSIKKGVKTVVSRLGKSGASLGTLCVGQDMLCIYDETDITTAARPKSTFDPHRGGPRNSFASFGSSDSMTLAVWLAERRVITDHVIDDALREMSVGEYELMGSWLDLGHCNGGWACGVQDCNMHTASGSPHVAGEYPAGLCMAMPFDSADLLSAMLPSAKTAALPFPAGPHSTPPRCHSLPRLPSQSFDIYSAQETKPVTAKRCLNRGRELSMPGGWTF